MICKQYDVVVVPFPFTARRASKRRPALALSTLQLLCARWGVTTPWSFDHLENRACQV